MKKYVFSFSIGLVMLAMISWIGRGESFAYLEDKIYCAFEEGQQLTLYLKKEEGIRKCEIYVNALEQLMKQKYDEILLVAQYISQGDDVIYRKEVFELTKQTFLKLVNYRTMLKENIQSFEQKFLLQYQSSLSQHLNDYLTKLSTLSKNLEQLPPPTSITGTSIIQQVHQQILTIEAILQTTSLDEMMNLIPNYLYLKQALEGK